ncbi:carboxymuconolactone decarboxylase family protein [Nocardia crassostreae]|uniref:carboxymuconolactone decarboxylase family protein n=1 Tax=Nocardia crassostreae TaxID=53428 RepID=UPI000B1042C0|nr:hypothetical protein [Nocardia crassostreae]
MTDIGTSRQWRQIDSPRTEPGRLATIGPVAWTASRIAGLTVRDVARVAAGPDADGWDERQRALLTAVDELVAHRCVSDDTWAALREFYDDRRMDDLCLLTGNYAMLAMLLNSVGAAVEDGGRQSRAVRWLRRGDATAAVLDRMRPDTACDTA